MAKKLYFLNQYLLIISILFMNLNVVKIIMVNIMAKFLMHLLTLIYIITYIG